MPRQIFEFDPPERFVVGTVGQPGERVFFLQARSGARVVSVALEKVQVAVLAERLTELLETVRRQTGPGGPIPAVPPGDLADNDPLEQPVLEEFRVGTMGLRWDGDDEKVTIGAQAQADGEDDDEADPLDDDTEGPDVLRVRLSPAHTRAFIQRAQRVVAAGRPPCPLCGLPLDPAGHVCPRQNGHRT